MIRMLAYKGVPTVCPLHGGEMVESPDRDVLVGGAGMRAAAALGLLGGQTTAALLLRARSLRRGPAAGAAKLVTELRPEHGPIAEGVAEQVTEAVAKAAAVAAAAEGTMCSRHPRAVARSASACCATASGT